MSNSVFAKGPGQRERSPDYQKLRVRDAHIWGIRRGQPNRSAMEGPHPGGTALLITVTSTPGVEGREMGALCLVSKNSQSSAMKEEGLEGRGGEGARVGESSRFIKWPTEERNVH
ncbi:hypothetical protein AAG570_009144 [Ranatra chinensis]|uniref:Uncharacterized protein n=1 Tax=Ranatra chinensis TaxID=642074 RepID=A0ABD0YSW5_9HEMI